MRLDEKLTILARIKQLEEEMLYWKKAHIELQSQFIKHKKECQK